MKVKIEFCIHYRHEGTTNTVFNSFKWDKESLQNAFEKIQEEKVPYTTLFTKVAGGLMDSQISLTSLHGLLNPISAYLSIKTAELDRDIESLWVDWQNVFNY
jgi:hypothetical protein